LFAQWPKPLPAVTRKVYNRSTRIRVEKKRKVLDAWATELRRIIGAPAAIERLAACHPHVRSLASAFDPMTGTMHR
jgi:hypothetical protein